ncbi:MAG: hypothetical protein MUO37_05235 [Methyloceanibacter sp.]|nr:hypothetical protein [Methyloceanibacter sp.]
MKKKKSLCEACSNKVVIKFHEYKKEQRIKIKCIYDFEASVYQDGNYGTVLMPNFIVDECSFFNRNLCLLKNRKKKQEEDSDDYGTDSSGNKMYGVTFTNIPGALLP